MPLSAAQTGSSPSTPVSKTQECFTMSSSGLNTELNKDMKTHVQRRSREKPKEAGKNMFTLGLREETLRKLQHLTPPQFIYSYQDLPPPPHPRL